MQRSQLWPRQNHVNIVSRLGRGGGGGEIEQAHKTHTKTHESCQISTRAHDGYVALKTKSEKRSTWVSADVVFNDGGGVLSIAISLYILFTYVGIYVVYVQESLHQPQHRRFTVAFGGVCPHWRCCCGRAAWHVHLSDWWIPIIIHSFPSLVSVLKSSRSS